MQSEAADGRADKARSNLKGIAWALAATVCFVAVTGIVRHLGSTMHPAQAAFLRYLFGGIFLIPVLMRLNRSDWRPRRLLRHAIRGLSHGIGVGLWFFAMTKLPIAEVTALGFTSPLFVTVGAALFLGESLRIRRLTAILIGFVGTVVILRPGGEHIISIGAAAMLTAAPLFAVSMLLAKHMTRDESPAAIVAFMGIFVTLTLAPMSIYVWRTPNLEELLFLAATAGIATLGHVCLTRGYALADMTVTQPVSFFQLLWAAVLGYIAFSEVPDMWTWIGGGIIVASATYIAHREARLGKQS